MLIPTVYFLIMKMPTNITHQTTPCSFYEVAPFIVFSPKNVKCIKHTYLKLKWFHKNNLIGCWYLTPLVQCYVVDHAHQAWKMFMFINKKMPWSICLQHIFCVIIYHLDKKKINFFSQKMMINSICFVWAWKVELFDKNYMLFGVE
jgi:hypothetical protein